MRFCDSSTKKHLASRQTGDPVLREGYGRPRNNVDFESATCEAEMQRMKSEVMIQQVGLVFCGLECECEEM